MSDLETDPPEVASPPAAGDPGPEFTVLEPRLVPLGGVRGVTVARTLPHRELPTVGAWCFLDHFGPDRTPMQVLPHPHIGLQTVTWLFAGEVRHRDGLGNDVVIRPGECNVMTAGHGIAHSELSPTGPGHDLHGLQLWVALPEAASTMTPAFEHHANLPEVLLGPVRGRVLTGTFAGATSAVTTYSPLLGVQLDLTGGSAMFDLDPDFEHAVLVIDGEVTIDGRSVRPGPLVHLGSGRDQLTVGSPGAARAMLLGGPGWTEPLVMWWNFVGRDHAEIVQARSDWESHDPRFAIVPGHGSERIPAPPIPATRMLPRRRRRQSSRD